VGKASAIGQPTWPTQPKSFALIGLSTFLHIDLLSLIAMSNNDLFPNPADGALKLLMLEKLSGA